ncbi:hypothetical protein FJ951_07860 [Mesorhizobium sp. B2-2-3]|uniref:hypothetical protein n=1 Tax=Mesorhizobium sp. B2-2-3 TaxID=2589963 RepID=UPI0011287BFC|nr:hypothetical protein [Mesorhizobium sp. B2-2-3]TPM51708.1 hypothetical protein FJ951_07860 [Mesorhizobium sp. B2-2-3]
MSDFDFVTYKARDFAYHYAMEKEYASCPGGRPRRIRNQWREESQRLFRLWDREVSRLRKAHEPFSDALMYREYYRKEMLDWSEPR